MSKNIFHNKQYRQSHSQQLQIQQKNTKEVKRGPAKTVQASTLLTALPPLLPAGPLFGPSRDAQSHQNRLPIPPPWIRIPGSSIAQVIAAVAVTITITTGKQSGKIKLNTINIKRKVKSASIQSELWHRYFTGTAQNSYTATYKYTKHTSQQRQLPLPYTLTLS